MNAKRFRTAAITAILAVGLISAFSASAAAPKKPAPFPGSITLTGPAAQSNIRGVVPIDWTWKTGSYAKSASTVDVSITVDGYNWVPIFSAVPIRDGGVDWDTGALSNVFGIRVTIAKSTLKSVVSPIIVDNTAPTVSITKPAPTEVIVDDATLASVRYVAGTTTLVADAQDNLSGVDTVVWKLDDTEIGRGATFQYNFSLQPGKHTLASVVTDKAGNSSQTSVEVTALPGPSAAQTPPTPDPSATPSAPGLPEVPPVPSPSAPALPSTDDLPTALPTP